MASYTGSLYRSALLSLLNKQIDWDTDAIKLQLHTSAYTPNLDTHRYQSDLTNEVANGNGYTTGGVTLANCAMTYTAAAAAVAWAGTTAYTVGAIVRPTAANGFVYLCVAAGTSAGSAPAWPTTKGLTVAEAGGLTWLCAGSGFVRLTANNPTAWSNATFTHRYAALVDTTPGSAATNPLIGLLDAGSDQVAAAGSVTVTWDANGIFQFCV